jgi:transcriptional regulator with XRE-family HTH domain
VTIGQKPQSPFTREVAARLRQWRHDRGWSQQELAARAGTSVQSVNAIENGYRSLTVEMLAKFAVAFGVEAWVLLRPEHTCPVCEGSPPRGMICGTCRAGGTR